MTRAHIHLLRGDDDFSAALRVKQIIDSLGAEFDPTMNLLRLDGKTAALEDIQQAVSTLPFFSGSRLVIIDSALSKIDKSRVEPFTALLASLPPTTQLVLIVEDHQKWRKSGEGWVRVWETLTPYHWLVQWLNAHPQAAIVDLGLPDSKQMNAWVISETKRQGGSIEPPAAEELSRHTGNDTSIASQEIAKLLTYVDFKRPVTRQDVLELVAAAGTVDTFEMLDRLMEGRTRDAQSMMRRLLDDSPPEVILGAVVHRVRQLILMSEALESGADAREFARKNGIFANKVEGYRAAAQRIGLTRLEALYRQLLQADVQAKTSAADLATLLELLVMQIGGYFEN